MFMLKWVKYFPLFVLLLLPSCKSFCDEEYYLPKIYQSLWPDFCLEHLTKFPDECSEQCKEKNGNFYLRYLIDGSAEAYIEKKLINSLSKANLIPSSSKICSFLFCNNCHQPVISSCFTCYDYDENDEEKKIVRVFNRCDCLRCWFNEYDYDEDKSYYLKKIYHYNGDSSDDGEVIDFIEKNWIRCPMLSIPHEYFDYKTKQFFSFLEQLLVYLEENLACLCFWPYRTKLACQISDIIYEKMMSIITNTPLKHLNNEKIQEFLYLKDLTEHGVVRGLFTHAFFYTQYRNILLSLIAWVESSNNDVLEISRTLNLLYDVIGSIQLPFIELYTECLGKHPHPKVYYERGMVYLHSGKTFASLCDIEKLIDLCPNGNYENLLTSDLYFQEGSAYAELGLYDKALKALTKSIEKDPGNKKVYLERAATYFELGKLDLAIEDFINSGYKTTPLDKESMDWDFAAGLLLGTGTGIQKGAYDFIPSILSSANGLSHGLWSLITSPIECSKEIVQTAKDVVQVLMNYQFIDTLTAIIPEIKELIENNNLSNFKKGEVFGYIIGKYGIDAMAIGGSLKAVDTLNALRKANSILTLEKLSKETSLIAEKVNFWEKTHIEAVEKIKKGEKTLKNYKEYYSENEVRKILHQLGFETFPRPKGIPENFRVTFSKKNCGMKYVHPERTDEYVRVMPGDPYSPYPWQQKPYVKHQIKGGISLDKNGNIVNKKSQAAHIPIDEFIFINKEK